MMKYTVGPDGQVDVYLNEDLITEWLDANQGLFLVALEQGRPAALEAKDTLERYSACRCNACLVKALKALFIFRAGIVN
jgi:L-lactate utilization protein LutB